MDPRAPRSASFAAGAALAAVALLAAAAHGRQSASAPPADHAERFDKGTRLFTAKVAAILTSRCFKCHGGEAVRGGLDLTTRESLLAGGKNGEVVLPFAASESRLMKLVRREERPGMPFKAEPLPDEEIAALADWIELGAPYAAPLKSGEEKKPGTRPRSEVTDADRDFWSFRPLVRPAPPDVKEAGWCLTPVDRFVKARLEAAGAEPAASAPPRVLVRRAFFDLVGEPPAPDDVDRFLAGGPQAWPELIERLLADRRFGERWGRHWLDLARFAESHGFEHDYDRANAWTYRDFVIRAFASDLPFDRFVRWQIAGDELAPDDPEAWYATGFLGAGVHATQITANQVEKERYDELDDMVATTGTAMLGLTIGCARCHDHKYDPIPTRDYYRLLSTFTKTVRSDYDVVTDAAEFRAQSTEWEAAHAPLAAGLERYERETMAPRIAAFIAARGEKGTGEPSACGAAAARAEAPWIVLEPTALVASGGAKFTRLADGSWLAGGERPERDDYTFTTHVDAGIATTLRALRIEALADPSLPHGGSGRADNGNFGLTEMTASFSADSAAGAPPPAPLAFAGARATFEQAGLPASAAIDGSDAQDGACWAVDPQFGRDHAAAFELAAPLDVAAGGTLVVTLRFHTNVHHGIGRLRVAAAEDARAGVAAPARPLALAAALATLERGDGELSADGRAALEAWLKSRDPGWRALREKVDAHLTQRPKPKLQKAMICSEGVPAIRLHTQGGDFLDATHLLKRGDPNQKLEVATQAFLQVLTRAPDGERRWQEVPAAGARTPGQRSALARWLTDVDQGAGALVARVAVNRIWQHLFGRGLVTTPSDFGAAGERPSHPELLEWLACELVESGWSVKHMVALLATSRVYLEGGGDESTRRADPEERLFARHPARRLEAESVRDAMLAVSGKLDDRPFGPGTLDVAAPRRSVYLFVKRSRLVPMMALFDAPNALSGLGRRQVTTVAPQSLFLMNDAVVREWAAAFARRLDGAHTESDFVRGAYALAFARPPSDGELADALVFLADDADALAREGHAPPLDQARVDLCQALFSANEFVYVE